MTPVLQPIPGKRPNRAPRGQVVASGLRQRPLGLYNRAAARAY